MKRLDVYRAVARVTTEPQRRAALVEELQELKDITEELIEGLTSNAYISDRHKLVDSIMHLWREIVDVMHTSEQNLDVVSGFEYLEIMSEVALKKLSDHLEAGTLADGLPEVAS